MTQSEPTSTKFVVLRKRWLNGSNTKPTHKMYLYHPRRRHMDILGFYLNSLGVLKKDLYKKEGISTDTLKLVRTKAPWLATIELRKPLLLDYFASPEAEALIAINDAPVMTDEARELAISAIFKMKGIEVSFV